MSSKKNLREEMRAKLAGMSLGDVAVASAAAARLLAGLEEFVRAEVVMLYLSVAGEIDCLPLAREAWQGGKAVLAPTACDNCRNMRPILCRPGDAEMFDISHGLRQPARRELEMEIQGIDLVVVPAMAFDRAGNRLGRGGGFYDRFLARPGLGAIKIGLAFDAQIVDTIPVGPHDLPVDIIVTDKEIIR